MFFNKDTYILEVTNLNNLQLYNTSNNNVLNKILVDDNIASNNEIIDEVQYAYIINKFLSQVNKKNRIVMRLNSTNNIFRFENIYDLDKKEMENYVKYNIDKIIPFGHEDFIIKTNYVNNQLYIYGINKIIHDYLIDVLKSLGLDTLFFTVFISEVVSKIKEFHINSVILNLQSNYFEMVTLDDFNITFHKVKDFNLEIIKGELNLSSKLIKEINNNLSYLETLDLNKYKLYLYGDNNIIPHWMEIINKFNIEVKEINFREEKYFGARK